MLAIAAAISIETAVNNLHSRELEIRTSGGAYIPAVAGYSSQDDCAIAPMRDRLNNNVAAAKIWLRIAW